jgi:serine protease
MATLRLEPLEDRTTPAVVAADQSSYATDRVLVTMANGADVKTAVTKLAASPHAAGVEHLGFDIYRVTLPAGVSPASALRPLSAVRGVAVAEPDYVVRLAATPNDPSYGSLWGLNNANDADIDAPEAWDVGTGTGGTVVAVIDSGVDYTHPDLAANMWRNPGETPGDGVDNDTNGIIDDVFGADFANNDGNPMDDRDHGTHVAGTIGAVGNNSVGVTGVAWRTRIMAVKFLNANGSGSISNAIRAINYAITEGASILNNSWGAGVYSAGLEAAIVNAKNAGAVFVAAAGNSGVNTDVTPNYPSNHNVDNVLSVAATDSNDNLASFSNYGATTVDLAAPGVSVLSTMPGGGYGWKSGTSMATPHVAGALAVYWDKNPTMTYTQVISSLLGSVDQKASLAGKTVTGGRLNLKSLMESPPPSPPPLPPLSPPPPPWEPPHAAPHRQKFGLSSLAVPINNMATAQVDIKVPGRPAQPPVVDLDVIVVLDHTYTADMVITITAPNGTTVTLFDRRGGAGDNLAGTRFDDEAAVHISGGSAPFRGSFRPEHSLSAFDWANPAGVWSLKVRDVSNRDVGVIKAVTLDVAGAWR